MAKRYSILLELNLEKSLILSMLLYQFEYDIDHELFLTAFFKFV